eukprot:CAMPEP_0206213386 /NCGR_PEP_ID=MMETSP0047_2-20121206/1095_1 /ASSEMBLY_ACC=CAM_ASM_000192 /TAXON_ID=195065 /ORGANISM="Chroomonas mesostigmatica_cf, Strain CCMP1168" /LENGTH=337 /DNA_ID=CAMNT_0053635533 /DNA_START=127 /DNA_END=1136 /DNA_ORIENTATION=+
MPFVEPAPTAGNASAMFWEDEEGSWAFVLQRHRTQGNKAITSVRKKLEGGVTFIHRILLTDSDRSVVAAYETQEDAKRDWEFLHERIVPQMQVHMRTYEDAKRVARGLFEAAAVYHTLQDERPLCSFTPFVLKAWQILADVVPLHAAWVTPSETSSASRMVWKEVEGNDFAVLEHNSLPLDQLGALWGMWGRAPQRARVCLRDKGMHVVAAGGEEAVGEVWEAFQGVVAPTLGASGSRPSDAWKPAACELLVILLRSNIPSCILPEPPAAAAEEEEVAAAAVPLPLDMERAAGIEAEARRRAFEVFSIELGVVCRVPDAAWLRAERARLATFLEIAT